MTRKTIIHVNQHAIRANSKGENRPVLTVKDYKQNRKGHKAMVLDDKGRVVGAFVYSPDKPLSCGAKMWFEAYNDVVVE